MPSQDIKDLFLKPLKKITFPKELEKKIYLYHRPPITSQRNKDGQQNNPVKKKQKNRKKKKQKLSQAEIQNLPAPVVKAHCVDTSSHVAEIEDPSLSLPQRKIEKSHKWPSMKPRTNNTLLSQVNTTSVEMKENHSLNLPERKVDRSHKWPSVKKEQFKINSGHVATDLKNNSFDLLGTLLNKNTTDIENVQQGNKFESQKLSKVKIHATSAQKQTVLADEFHASKFTPSVSNAKSPSKLEAAKFSPFISKSHTTPQKCLVPVDELSLQKQTVVNMPFRLKQEQKKSKLTQPREKIEEEEPLPPGDDLKTLSPELMPPGEEPTPPGIDLSPPTSAPSSPLNLIARTSPEPLPPGVEPSPPNSEPSSPYSIPNSMNSEPLPPGIELNSYQKRPHAVPNSSNSEPLPPGIDPNIYQKRSHVLPNSSNSEPLPPGIEHNTYQERSHVASNSSNSEPLPPGIEPYKYQEGHRTVLNSGPLPAMKPDKYQESLEIFKDEPYPPGEEPSPSENTIDKTQTQSIPQNNFILSNKFNELVPTPTPNDKSPYYKRSQHFLSLHSSVNQFEPRPNFANTQVFSRNNDQTRNKKKNHRIQTHSPENIVPNRERYNPKQETRSNHQTGKQENWSNNQSNMQITSQERWSRNHGNTSDSRGDNRRITRSNARAKHNDDQPTYNAQDNDKLIDLVGNSSPMDISVMSLENRKRKVHGPEVIKKKKRRSQKELEASRVYRQRKLENERRLAEEKKQEKFMPCVYFQKRGECSYGDDCRFSHDVVVEKRAECCKFYISGACLKGDNCIFYHSEWPCKFFHTRGYCKSGDQCKFSHTEITDKDIKQAFEARIEYEKNEEALKTAQVNDVSANTGTSLPVLNFEQNKPSSMLVESVLSETTKDEPAVNKEELNDNKGGEKHVEEFKFPSLYYELT